MCGSAMVFFHFSFFFFLFSLFFLFLNPPQFSVSAPPPKKEPTPYKMLSCMIFAHDEKVKKKIFFCVFGFFFFLQTFVETVDSFDVLFD